jgi:hypothetical protein
VRERRLAGEHNVVAAGALDFEESQRGFGEVDAVATLGVAGDLGVRAITASDRSLSSSTTVAITVQSAAQQAAALQAQINALRGPRTMNQGQANSLNVKLDLKNNAGDVGKVQSFLNEVAAYQSAGILTQTQANALTAAGNILWTSLRRR